MPRLQARPHNVVASDSEDELAMKPTPRRQTRSVTNSPRKALSQPGGLLSSSQENATPADTHDSSAQDGEADDEDDKKDVLATQSPSVRNARTPKRRGASARKSPIGSSSQRKGAGKRQPLGTSRAAGASFPVAASRFDSDVSDSELTIPGLPEGRKWLHSVRCMYQCSYCFVLYFSCQRIFSSITQAITPHIQPRVYMVHKCVSIGR
jgi:hypothetical protein